MPTGRTESLVATCDQWLRATHRDTAVEGTAGVLTLTWHETLREVDESDAAAPQEGQACPARGVAIDRLCRVYRLTPDSLERLRVGPTDQGLDYAKLPAPVRLIGPARSTSAPGTGADFAAAAPDGLCDPLGDPVGVAVDDDDRLFLADRARRSVSVLDLWSRRLLRSVAVDRPGRPDRHPMGLTSAGGDVYAVVRRPAGILRLTATRGPSEVPLPASVADLPPGSQPSRIAVLADGGLATLWHDTDGQGWVVAGARPPRQVGAASDIIVDAEGALVIAPCAGSRAVLRRLVPTATGWTRTAPLDAAGYDGGGLVATRDGRIGYFTARGFRLAVRAPVAYATDGDCVTYRLDSGVPRNRWGRLLVDACVPDGTDVLLAATTSDDEYATAASATPPEPASCVPVAPGASPPLPPEALLPASEEITRPVHRRPGATTPWWRSGDDFETFEAPTDAPEGRYLWVTIRLTGNGRRTPSVREIRVERQAHALLRRVPEVYSAEPDQADFLHRYLAMFDGMLHDLDLRALYRDILVDPHASPVEALDWLASFFGLLLDDRWAESARRQLVAEIVRLFRFRGTVWALRRYLEIFLAGERAQDWARGSGPVVSPVLIEHFRLRGLGGPLLGADPSASSRSVLGHGFRVGGAVGPLESASGDATAPGPAHRDASSFASHAHRFTVVVPQPLSPEQEAAVRHVLDTERPAHTTYELCTVDAGMRLGRGTHVGLSTVVGRTGAFEIAVTDRSLLGRGAILGGSTSGTSATTVAATRLDDTARVGWMAALTVAAMHARYRRVRPERLPALDAALAEVAREGLGEALGGLAAGSGAEHVCLRRLTVPLALDSSLGTAALTRAWSGELASALGARLSELGSGDPEDMVVYPRTADAVVDLVRSLARGDRRRAWAWQMVGILPADPPDGTAPDGTSPHIAPPEVAAVLERRPELVPLVWQSSRDLPRFPLSPRGWLTVARAMAELHRSPSHASEPSAGPPQGPPSGQVALTADGVLLARQLPWSEASPGQRTDLAVLLLACTHPSLARDAATLAVTAQAWARLSAVDRPPASPALPPDADWDGAPQGAGADGAEPAGSAGPHDSGNGEDAELVTRAGIASRTPPTAQAPTGATPPAPGDSTSMKVAAAEQPAAGSGSAAGGDSAQDPAADHIPAPSGPTPQTSAYGGLLLLVGPLDAVVADLRARDHPLSDLPLGEVLARLAVLLSGADREDPAIHALAGWPEAAEAAEDPYDPAEPLARAQQEALASLAQELGDRLRGLLAGDEPSLDWLWHRRVTLLREPGWLEAVFPADEVDTRIRRAGLDLDPGYVWWLGSVVRYRYV